MFRGLITLLVSLSFVGAALAQSQAVNGTIEGMVRDTSGAVLPGVIVTATNLDTGSERSLVTDATGTYRAALLPLGHYRIKAELAGFKTIDRAGISLSAGQTAVANFDMQVGGVQEVVEVTANSPVTEPAKIDLGRTIGEVEFKNLPLVSRNSFNFGLLQPNVTGYEDVEFGATRVNANGSQMRTNYQIDGSNATQKNRAGLRMFQPSEIMVREVKVVTSGFAPEFGQTTGMVYNAITPSGTNRFSGDGSYRFRRKSFSSRPFTLAASAPKPDTHVDDFAGTLGGPIVRDKLHFYLGYERVKKDLSADRVITVTPANILALGLSTEAIGTGVIPAIQTVNMFIAKTDYQINSANRLTGRWSIFQNTTPENINGALNTREASFDFEDRMDSAAVQLVSALSANKLNELRIAYGRRDNPLTMSAVAGPGPQVQIPGVATFNGTRFSPNTPVFLEDYWQVVNNFSWFSGRHNVKGGIDLQFISDERAADVTALYTFPDVASYLAARDGTNPRGYTRFQQNVGDPVVEYSQRYYSFFVQDDFRVTPRVKLLFGVRYDLFQVPDGVALAPHPASREFRVDRNNFGPRVGLAWSLDNDSRTVVRASTGLMYEAPLGAFYEDAIQQNGNPRFLTASVTPGQPGSPSFPGTLSSLPAGITPSRSIRIVGPDFDTQYAVLSNAQVERALTGDLSVAVGYVNSTGRNLPLVLNSNVIPTGATLPDGRPIYSTGVGVATRVDPSFDVIREVRSTGTSAYNAMTVSLTKRTGHGFQALASYTLAKAEDDGVIGGDYVVGSTDRSGISDPSNQKRDYGHTSWNTTHTFVLSAVISPTVKGDGVGAMLLSNNQIGLVVQANSGLPFNIRSNRDLNLDAVTDADRPNSVARNSGNLGSVFDVDGRFSRFVPLADRRRVEVFAEAKNLFNHRNIRAVNSVVSTDAAGNPLAPIPGEFPVTSTYESRQFQLGFKLHF